MLKGNNLTFAYKEQPERRITDAVSFEIKEGDFIALVGTSGSGKTTFVKLLNGLLKATSGTLTLDGEDVYAKDYPISKLRRNVGLVFQYPEHQLFGKTVLLDAMYGPLKLGMDKDEAEAAARASLELVGMSEDLYMHSPLELSGGQKRCVAIAGVLAMNPGVLIMDEPAAGLDPETKKLVFDLISRIKQERNLAVILISHHMEDVVKYADTVWVLHNGRMEIKGTPKEVFSRVEELRAINIGIPQITGITDRLIRRGYSLEETAVTVEEAADLVMKLVEREVAL